MLLRTRLIIYTLSSSILKSILEHEIKFKQINIKKLIILIVLLGMFRFFM